MIRSMLSEWSAGGGRGALQTLCTEPEASPEAAVGARAHPAVCCSESTKHRGAPARLFLFLRPSRRSRCQDICPRPGVPSRSVSRWLTGVPRGCARLALGSGSPGGPARLRAPADRLEIQHRAATNGYPNNLNEIEKLRHSRKADSEQMTDSESDPHDSSLRRSRCPRLAGASSLRLRPWRPRATVVGDSPCRQAQGLTFSL